MIARLTPAYGRDYRTGAEVLADFNADKDFIISDGVRGTYINKEQFPDAGIRTAVFTFDKGRKTLRHNL